MATNINNNGTLNIKTSSGNQTAGLGYVVTAVDSNGKPTATKLIYEKEHDWELYDYSDPTCEDSGYYTYHCSRYDECGGEYTDYYEALGHNWDSGVITKQPTCGDTGIRTYTCQNDSSHTYTETIAATGNHNWGNWVSINYRQHERTCSVCGATQVNNHGFGYYENDDSTHTKYCTSCNFRISESHNYGDNYTCNDLCNHTCTHSNYHYQSNNNYSHRKVCEDCSWVGDWESCYNGQTNGTDIGETGHTSTCSHCGFVGTYQHEDINGNGLCDWCGRNICSHPSTTRVTTPATCVSYGSVQWICNTCGEVTKEISLSPNNNHTNTWGDSSHGGCYDCGAEWCLIEGTLITMADGTQKPIEEVKSGDLILSYDPNTETQVSAVVISAYLTGVARKFQVYSFNDGNYLTAYGQHSIYSKGKGTTKDIQNITRNDIILNVNGDTVQWTRTSELLFHGRGKRRYNLVSSNNLYYANNILVGHKPFSKLQRVITLGLVIPEAVENYWNQDCEDYNNFSNFLNTPEFHKEVVAISEKKSKAEHMIEVNKRRLKDSDYKVQKYTEGLINDKEWKKSKDSRSKWRKEVTDNENAIKEQEAAYQEIVKKYRKGATGKSLFEQCCKRDNELFDTIKEAFDNNTFFTHHTHTHNNE